MLGLSETVGELPKLRRQTSARTQFQRGVVHPDASLPRIQALNMICNPLNRYTFNSKAPFSTLL